jgi:hypothetical protein
MEKLEAGHGTKKDKYTYWVTWSEDDNEYVGLCAEFSSWISKFELAGTPEKALKGVKNLVSALIELPTPS